MFIETEFDKITFKYFHNVGSTYEETLKKNNIEYRTMEIPLEKEPIDINLSSYRCDEIQYTVKNGALTYAYSFIIGYHDDYECNTYVSFKKLTSKQVQNLSIASFSDKLIYIKKYDYYEAFCGFDIDESGYFNLSELEGKYIDLNGRKYYFTEFKWFPEGIYGTVDEHEVALFVIFTKKNNYLEPQLYLCETGSGWKKLSAEQMKVFGVNC